MGMTETEYLESTERTIRRKAHEVADQLRRVADDIDRIADDRDLFEIPSQVVHKVMWGMANANVDDPAIWLAEYIRVRDSIAERAGEGDE